MRDSAGFSFVFARRSWRLAPCRRKYMPPTTSGCACALVDPQAAEALRRRLDDCGYLDTGRRAFRAESGAVALPLTAAGEAYAVQHGELSLAFLPPPTTDRRTSDKRQRMHGRCVAALESSGLPRADAARLFPVQSLPSKWEKLGDVALFAPRGMFEPGSGAAEALAALAPAARESLLAALAAEAGAARLGVQGRIGQVEEALHRKSGARLVWPPGAGGWVSFKENGVLYGRVAHYSASSSSLLCLLRPPPPSSSASSALLRPPAPPAPSSSLLRRARVGAPPRCAGSTCVARCSAPATAPRRRAWAASRAPARRCRQRRRA